MPAVKSLAAVLIAVPPVLDGIVTPAVEMAGNLGPPLTMSGNQLLNFCAFQRCDGIVVKTGLEVLVIAFAALLGRTRAERL